MHLLYNIMYLFTLYPFTHCFTPYYGNIPLDAYISTQSCPSSRSSKWIFILVANLASPQSPSPRNVSTPLPSACFSIVYTNIIETDLSVKLKQIEAKLPFKQIVVFFTFSLNNPSQPLFTRFLHSLDRLYAGCGKCRPFTIAFLLHEAKTVQTYSTWIRQTLPQLEPNFRCTFTLLNRPTLHLRPLLHSCHLQPGLFLPLSSSDFTQLQTPPKRCNLNGSTLFVAVNDQLPYCQVLLSLSGSLRLGSDYSIDTDILRLLQAKYHFVSALLHGQHINGLSYNNHTGKYKGLVGAVYSKAASLALCTLSIGYTRLAYVDFTSPTAYDKVTFLTVRPGLLSRKWLFTRPFSPVIWSLIFASLLVLTLLIWTIFRTQNTQKSASLIVTLLFGSLLGQSANYRKFPSTSLSLLSIWLFACLILGNSFIGLFHSQLTLAQYGPPVDTLEDLLRLLQNKATGNTLFTGAFYLDAFRQSSDDLIGAAITRYAAEAKQLYLLDGSKSRTMEILAEKWPAILYIDNASFLRSFVNSLSGLGPVNIGREHLGEDWLGIALSKGSPLLEPFNYAIRQFHEHGIIVKIRENTYAKLSAQQLLTRSPSTEKYLAIVLRLADLSSIFFIWSLALLAAGFTFICELTVKHCQN